MNIDEIRNKILSARENRASLRAQCAKSGCHSLTISLNVPGYPKSMPMLTAFFDDVISECKRFLQAHRISVDAAHEMKQIDEAGDFYLLPLPEGRPLAAIKAHTETFEERHPLGRIVDIDLTDRGLQPVSSGKLKQCLLCEQPAAVCMREGNHTYQELREHIVDRIRCYLADRAKQRTCKQLAALALKAILYEISLSPKPGLVGRFEQGAHLDMDYFTFIDSTAVLAGYFEELALLGHGFQEKDLREALPAIRDIGLRMEDSMFSTTQGVNTQKGLIFLIGLALFSSACCLSRDGFFAAARCSETIAAICEGLVQNELRETTAVEQTHGKACFQRYGSEVGGVRKEAECGLPSVFNHGLPELKSALQEAGEAAGASGINRALKKALLRLMVVTNDTNIIYRKNIEVLKAVQRMAQQVLDAHNWEVEAERYADLLSYCQREYVSPGGSADLLAVSLFLHFVERSFPIPTKDESTD
jgi:holo-ACP synthase / triphosphoribosyl-dephospho-CoA synthase